MIQGASRVRVVNARLPGLLSTRAARMHPEGPFTSPANAPLAETPTSIATEAATTSSRFILYPLFLSWTLPGVLYVRSLLLR